MSIVIPTPIPTSSQWQVVDWLDAEYTSQGAAGGIAQIALDQLPDDTRWRLTHMVVGCTSTTTTRLRLYLDTITNGRLRDGSNSGNFDVADWAAGLMVPPGRGLLAVWTGASDGALATLTVQAEILRRVG